MGAPLLSRGRRAAAGGRLAARALAAAFLVALAAAACAPPQAPADAAGPGGDTTAAIPSGPLPLRFELDRVVGSYGAGPGNMAYPEGVAVDDLGRIYVSDTGNDRVLRFDQAGVFLGQTGGFGFEEGQFDKPRDLVVNRGLALWVLDGENARVVKYDLEGRLGGVAVDFHAAEAQGTLGRVLPGGLSAEPGGFLYVTDMASDRLLALDGLGGNVTSIGGYGTQPGRFRHPTGVAVSPRGTLLVADGGNARVQALDSFGSFLRAWPLAGEIDGRVAVCWLPDGTLAVAERDSSRITLLAADGRRLARLEAVGAAPGQIDHPSALAADRQGRLYVADTNNHRIEIFRITDRRAPASR